MKAILLTTLISMTSIACAQMHSAMTLRHRESNGIGYSQGYSTLDYYLTSQHDKLEFLFNLRGHLFNNAQAAGNGGVGFRYSLNEQSSVLGVNLFYDVRDAKQFIAQQISGGLEWLSRTLDVRLNGYLPIGNLSNFTTHRFRGFSGNQGIIRSKFTGALPCVEGELGTPLARPFYVAVGSYYLFRETTRSLPIGNAVGFKARLDVDMGNYFSLGALVTHDRIFNTRIQGYLALNIPFGPWKSMKDTSRNFEKRRIVRHEIIPIQSKKKSKNPLGSDKNEATRFLFVNNLAAPWGEGTFESPFSSLKEAEKHSNPGDIIYVYPGDGTPRHMDEGIVLQDNQVLASSGSELEVNNVVIPAQTPGLNPTITNIHPHEPVITNPGKTQLNNFYYMSPWEYMGLLDPPSYSTSPPFSPSMETPTTPYPLSELENWVFVNPQP